MSRFIHCILVLTLATALVGLGVVPGQAADGDANGDHFVDVRDLQLVISEVLGSTLLDGKGDVNGDGQVDVLDYQYILAQASAAQQGTSSTIPEPEHRTTQTPSSMRCLGVLAARSYSLVADSRESGLSCVPPSANGDLASSRTIRYVYRLTSNAPPQAA